MKKIVISFLLFSFCFSSLVTVTIPKGATTSSIATMLKEQGIIQSELKFKLIAKLHNKEKSFIPGNLRINVDTNYLDIIEQLQDHNNYALARITIPEGYNLFQIDALLTEAGLLKANEFYSFTTNKEKFIHLLTDIQELYNEPDLVRLEGFLFPDTYFFEYDTTVENIVKNMVNLFKIKVIPLYKEALSKGTLPKRHGVTLKFYNLISLASIVESEAVVAEERERIAGVFVNRMNKRMILGACPTVHYARLLEGLPRIKDLSYEDTRIISDYNTYINQGLPPSPISSPGLASIKASFNPEKNNLLFFVSKNDGTHHFSKTEQEHNSWKRKYYAN